jgi:hypothetical protein
MSEFSHLICPCQQCGGFIEFSEDAVGHEVSCPHCGQQTILFIPSGEETQETQDEPFVTTDPQPTKGRRGAVALLVLAVAAIAAGVFVFRDKFTPSRPAPVSQKIPTNEQTAVTEPSVSQTNPSTPAKLSKSIDDLKVGPIALEKTKGSSLVYAVGVLRNDSSHQRFGVNIELELTDARGNKAGMAKDYRAVLDPRQEWRFRALVLDSKAVSAKVAAIREEE